MRSLLSAALMKMNSLGKHPVLQVILLIATGPLVTVYVDAASLELSGSLTWSPGTVQWEGKLGWTLPNELGRLSLSADDTGLTKLRWDKGGRLGPWGWKGELSFVKTGFEHAILEVKFPWIGVEVGYVGVLEGNGFGWGLELRGGKGLVEKIKLRWNLLPFSPRVKQETFTPTFSYGEITGSWEACCNLKTRGYKSFNKSGFENISLGFRFPLWKELGVWLRTKLTFTTDEKEARILPELRLESPMCVEAYARVEEEGKTLKGIELYGVGFYCRWDAWRFRILAELGGVELVPGNGDFMFSLVRKNDGNCGGWEWGGKAIFGGTEASWGLLAFGMKISLQWPAIELTLSLTLPVDAAPKISAEFKCISTFPEDMEL